jgi:pimeloyl-ACP methyl ester carboxylesterase
VLFIHGLGGSSSYFAPIISRLSKTYELHITDLEGHGLSLMSTRDNLTISFFAQDIQQVYEQHSPGRSATVIAHSMGSLVALKLSIEHPQLVSKLILMGPPSTPLPAPAAQSTFQRAELVRSQGMLAVVDAIIAGGTSAHSKATNPLAIAAVRLSLLGQDPDRYANACVALARPGSETLDVSRIQVPILLLTGSDDDIGVHRRFASATIALY